MTNITSLYGGPTGQPEPVQSCIEVLSELLEMAKAGQVIGATVVMLHCDGLASYAIGGRVGGYSLIGAMEAAKLVLMGASHE